MDPQLALFYKDVFTLIDQKDVPSRSTELHLRKAFRYFDIQENNKLDKENFKRAIQRLGLNITANRVQVIDEIIFADKKQLDYLPFIDELMRIKERPVDQVTVYTSKDYHSSLKAMQRQTSNINLLRLLKDFSEADVTKTQQLNADRLIEIVENHGLKGIRGNIEIIIDTLDKRLNKKINYLDFTYLLSSDMKPPRVALVEEMFEKLSISQKVSVYNLISKWNLMNHPDVKNHIKMIKNIEIEFNDGLKAFAACKKVGSLSLNDFKEFMTFISSPIDSDNYFKLILERIFNTKLQSQDDLKSVSSLPTDGEISVKFQTLSHKYRNVKSDIIDRSIIELSTALKERGILTFMGFLRYLVVQDKLKTNRLSFVVFKQALADYKVLLDQNKAYSIFKYFQKDTFEESIKISELISTLVAQLPPVREKIVEFCFEKLNYSKNNQIEVRELIKSAKDYKTADPNIVSFSLSSDITEALNLHQELTNNRLSYIAKSQFVDFYRYISVFIEEDKSFEHYILNSWKIFGDSMYESQISVNTVNRRPQTAPYGLYPNTSGHQYIGVKSIDKSDLSMNLKNKGIAAGKESGPKSITSHFGKKDGFVSDADKILDKLRNQASYLFISLEGRLFDDDLTKKGEIAVKTFQNAVNTFFKGKFNNQEIEDLSALYINKNGLINYRRFASDVIRPLGNQVNSTLEDLFKVLDIFKINVVVLEVIKNRFKSSHHPLVATGKKTDYEAHQEFTNCMDVFCKTFKTRTNKNTYEFSSDDFNRLFQYYLLEVSEDVIQNDILKKCFKI